MSVANFVLPSTGFSAERIPVDESIAQIAPAATIGEASCGRPVNHWIAIESGVAESAKSPSEHGTKTSEPYHAVPPQAPAQTLRLATWPPIPPSAPILSR